MNTKPCIVFDMDGILLDSEALVRACWEALGPRFHIPNPVETFRLCLGTTNVRTGEILRERCGADFPWEEYRQEIHQYFYQSAASDGIPCRPYAEEALHGLHDLGYPLAVASSTRECTVRRELGEVGLLPLFSVVIGGDQLQHSKPEPDIYLLACEQLHTDPATAYAVEDSYNGIRSAHRAGMMPIMVPDQLPPTAEMRQLSRHLFPDLRALYRHFQEQEQ